MNSASIAIISLFAGIGLSALVFFLWHCLKEMRDLKRSVDLLTRRAGEVLEEGSFGNLAKALRILGRDLPDLTKALQVNSKTVKLFCDTVLGTNANREQAEQASEPQITVTTPPKPEENGSSGFFGYNDKAAQDEELKAEGRRVGIVIPDEKLQAMRTDDVVEPS